MASRHFCLKGIPVRLSAKGVFRGMSAAVMASVLVACGGGGGGGGGSGGGNSPLVPNPAEELKLTFSADRTTLPLNIAGDAAAIGSAYTSTINLRSSYVPGGGTQGGNCWTATFSILSGAPSGALFTTGGGTLGATDQFQVSTSGAWTVLLNATSQAGTVVIEAAVPDPNTATVTCNDTKVEIGARFSGTPISYVRKQFQVVVGQASGKASQIRVNTSAPNFLFAQGTNGTTQLQVQAQVLDEAGQRVPDPASGVRNVYASILGTSGAADDDALLRSAADGGSRKWVLARTVNGQADFTLVSGSTTGSVFVEILADRFDNNVENGITDPVRNAFAVPVVASAGQDALVIETATDLPAAEEEKSYATILTASGGVPPYKWERVLSTSLPVGLSLSSDGIISGTPFVDGTFRFALKVTDSATVPQSAVKEFSITIVPAVPVPGVLQIATTGLPDASECAQYLTLLTAAAGTPPYTWSAAPSPFAGSMVVNADGVVTGKGPAFDPAFIDTDNDPLRNTYKVAFTVKDSDGQVATRNFTIVVTDNLPGATVCP